MIKLRNKKGFSLIELMIVVMIIGLLAVLSIPNLYKAWTTARKNVCINNLKQIESAKTQWGIENNKPETDTPRLTDLDPYIKGGTIELICPAGGTTFEDSYKINNIRTDPECLIDPASHNLP